MTLKRSDVVFDETELSQGNNILNVLFIGCVEFSEIALKTSLAAYHIGDEEFMQECWYEAYDSDTTVVNYLRLFTAKNSILKYKCI